MNDEITTLPLYPHLDRIADEFARAGIMLLSAEPGAGKTTLVPWKLLTHPAFAGGKILMLEPRRIAARAAAMRIASLLGEETGATVGLRTRHETITGPRTRLEVITEGVLVRLLGSDPSLEGCRAVIFDEFHERNLPAELALAFAWDSRSAIREDLSILVMSATLPAQEFIRAFGEWPCISIPGRSHPVEVLYRPPAGNERMEAGAARLAIEALGMTDTGVGDVLVFLPGYREMKRTMDLLRAETAGGISVEMLHGQMAPEEQRRVLGGFREDRRRIILATNVAESSLTIPGVRAVADAGFERRVSFSPRTGMDHRETVRISDASARQRTGRAGRLGPGLCLRWWFPTEKLEPASLPEVCRADLAPLVLACAAWGAGSALDLVWITPPPEAHIRRASALLARLGMLDESGKITADGRRAESLGLHPRLAHMIDAAPDHEKKTAALIVAMLEEGEGTGTGSADFRDRLEAWMDWDRGRRERLSASGGKRIADEARRILRLAGSGDVPLTWRDIDPGKAGALLLLAYPDRAARRTSSGNGHMRYVMAEGRAGLIPAGFEGGDFIVALEMDGGLAEARIYSAVPVDRSEIDRILKPLEDVTTVTWQGWIPTVRVHTMAGGLQIHERRAVAAPEDIRASVAGRIRETGLSQLPMDEGSLRFLARCRFVGRRGLFPDWPDFSDEALVRDAEEWLLPFGNYGGGEVFTGPGIRKALEFRLGYSLRSGLDETAPESVTLPSGSRRAIDYESGNVPVIATRLQEFFGCDSTPMAGGEPVLLHLLSPAGRPVQITRDLKGFWERSYKDVRKELLGRYPRHYWPEDPMQAEPTSRAKPGKR